MKGHKARDRSSEPLTPLPPSPNRPPIPRERGKKKNPSGRQRRGVPPRGGAGSLPPGRGRVGSGGRPGGGRLAVPGRSRVGNLPSFRYTPRAVLAAAEVPREDELD